MSGAKQRNGDDSNYFSTQSLQISNTGMERRTPNNRNFNGNHGNSYFDRSRSNKSRADYRNVNNRSSGEQRRDAHNNNYNLRAGGSVVCVFCKGEHLASRCRVITDVNTRYDIVKRERLCFICLKGNHTSNNCRLVSYECIKCKRKHNIALCSQDEQRKPGNPPIQINKNNNTINATHVEKTSEASDVQDGIIQDGGRVAAQLDPATTTIAAVGRTNENNEILLQSALAVVSAPDESTSDETCILFDSCNHRTYVTSDLQ